MAFYCMGVWKKIIFEKLAKKLSQEFKVSDTGLFVTSAGPVAIDGMPPGIIGENNP